MTVLVLILLVLGVVLVGLEAFGVSPQPRPRLGWLGVGCWMVALLIERLGHS